MRIKMTAQQCRGVRDLLNYVLENDTPDNNAEKLIRILVKRVFVKIRAKSEKDHAKDWCVTISEEEALALNIYFTNLNLGIHFAYEQSVCTRISHEIDQKYA